MKEPEFERVLSFIDETRNDELMPSGATPPKRGDFRNWTDVLANMLAPGSSAAKLRSYLKTNSVETWEYVNWLTHAKNAIRMDGEIGLKSPGVEELEEVGEAHGNACLLGVADPGETKTFLLENIEEALYLLAGGDGPDALCGVFARPLDESPEPPLPQREKPL